MEFWSIHMYLSLASGRLSPKRTGVNYVCRLCFADYMWSVVKLTEPHSRSWIIFWKFCFSTLGSLSIETRVSYSLLKAVNLQGSSLLILVFIGHLPIKYLGLPLSHNYLKTKDFLFLLDKFRAQTESWILKTFLLLVLNSFSQYCKITFAIGISLQVFQSLSIRS